MDNLGPVYYDPYRPQMFGDGMSGMAMQTLMNMATSQAGFQIQAPTGYSNSAQLWSKMQMDRYHQQAMQLAGQMTSQRVGNLMASVVAPAMNSAGRSFTPQQQMAFQQFATNVTPMLYSMGMQSQQGRFLADLAAGGYNPANILSAYTLNKNTMIDSVTRGNMSFDSIKAQSQYLFDDLYGGTALDRRRKTAGFLPGEVTNIMTSLARQGRLGGNSQMNATVNNPLLMQAINSGALNQTDLDNLGIGSIRDVAGQDLNDPQVQDKLRKIAAARQSGSVQQMAKVSAAVKDILVNSGLAPSIIEIQEAVATFTEKYSTQLGGARTSALLRQSHAALKDFGYGFKEMLQMQDIAAQTAGQFGYENAFAPILASNQSIFMGSLLKNQRFESFSYGKANAFQQAQMRGQMEAGFGRSTKGNALAALSLLAESNKVDTSTEEGRRVAAILKDIEGSNYIGDQAFVGMSPQEQAELIARGLGVSTDRVLRTMSQQFPLEAQIAEKNLTRFAGQFAADDLAPGIKAAAINNMMSEFQGLDLETQMAYAELLGDAAVTNIRENPFLDNRKMHGRTSGAITYQEIKRKAEAGDEYAKKLLEHAGSSEQQQREFFDRMALYGLQGVEGQYGAATNLNIALGAQTEAELGAYRVDTNMEALKGELLSQTSLGSLQDVLVSAMSAMEASGQGAVDGQSSASNMLEAIKNAVGGQMSSENEEVVLAALQELQDLSAQQDAVLANSDDPRSQAARDAAQQYKDKISEVMSSIMDNTGLRLAEEGEAEGWTQNEKGEWQKTGVPAEVAQHIEANFGGVTIQLGDDAIIQIKDAMIKTERGTVNTVGNQ